MPARQNSLAHHLMVLAVCGVGVLTLITPLSPVRPWSWEDLTMVSLGIMPCAILMYEAAANLLLEYSRKLIIKMSTFYNWKIPSSLQIMIYVWPSMAGITDLTTAFILRNVEQKMCFISDSSSDIYRTVPGGVFPLWSLEVIITLPSLLDYE